MSQINAIGFDRECANSAARMLGEIADRITEHCVKTCTQESTVEKAAIDAVMDYYDGSRPNGDAINVLRTMVENRIRGWLKAVEDQ